MSKPTPLRHDMRRRGGFTLLEVVIALAIFVFGALAIIRIFPPALGVIQNSGDQLVALNLNNSTLARFNKVPESVPYGTFDSAAEAATSNWNDLAVGAVIGTARRNNSLPRENLLDIGTSALGHYRNIAGETHTVPSDGVILTQHPFVYTTAPSPVVNPLLYEEDDLTGVVLKGDGTLDLTNARLASTDTAYTLTANDRIYITYQWMENTRVWGMTDEPLDYPLVTSTPKVVQTPKTGFTSDTSGTVYLFAGEVPARLHRLITPATPVYDGDRGSITATDLAGKTVLVDYEVNDWRWLVQDGAPTLAVDDTTLIKPRGVNLAARPLDNTLGTADAFTLLKDQATSSGPTLTSDSGLLGNYLDQKTGQITFETDTYKAPMTRVVYRALDNWAQQLSVAPPNYKLYFGRTPTVEDWRDCVLDNDKINMYFKPSEAGKTVMVSYSYGNPAFPTGSQTAANDIQVKNRILAINEKIDDTMPTACPLYFLTPNGNRLAKLELTDIDGNPLNNTDAVTSIRSIQGLSIQARTAWLDGNHFTQAVSTGFRGAIN